MISQPEIEARTSALHAPGIIDLHFDLLMDLYEKRTRANVLAEEFLPEFEAGGVGVIAAAIYVEDQYLPERALEVGVNQIARLYHEADGNNRVVLCRSSPDIATARAAGKIAILIAMEGVEPLGDDLDLLRIFYALGVRLVGLTHARRNAAGSGGIFAPSGSPATGLTDFGREVVSQCERLGIILDLAHINPRGFDEVVEITTKPLIVSHSNARKFYDIERNISDDQVRTIGKRGGVIGVNTVLVSPEKEKSTIDHYIDHIEHIIDLAGIESVGIGFDFFEFIWKQWPEQRRRELAAKLTEPNIIPDLRNHADAKNLTRRLVARGFSDEQIAKILRDNWMRILRQLL